MPVKIPCQKCNAVLVVSSKVPLGTAVKCPRCKQPFRIPDLSTRRPQRDVPARAVRSVRSGRGGMLKRAGRLAVLTVLLAVAGVGYYLHNSRGASKGDTEVAAVVPVDKGTLRQDTVAVPKDKGDPAPREPAPLEVPKGVEKVEPQAKVPVEAKLPEPMPEPKTKPEPMPEPKAEVKVEPKPELKLTPEEDQILQLVNKARASSVKKPPALKPNLELFKIARAQAAKIATVERLDEDLDEKKLGMLLTEGGYKFKAGKIGANQTADNNLQPNAAFQAMFSNNVTKDILLEPNEDTGIGIVKSGKGETFYLMIYATPDK